MLNRRIHKMTKDEQIKYLKENIKCLEQQVEAVNEDNMKLYKNIAALERELGYR